MRKKHFLLNFGRARGGGRGGPGRRWEERKGGGGLGGGRPRGDPPKIPETATPMGVLLNFGRARKGTGEKGLGRRRGGVG